MVLNRFFTIQDLDQVKKDGRGLRYQISDPES
jgi:hypothetical protein